MKNQPINIDLFTKAVDLLYSARKQIVHNVNQTMVFSYYQIGRMIVEEEQQGKDRAEYGKHLIEGLSEKLTKEFGKGYSQRNIEQIRQFYLVYSKAQTLSAEFGNSKTQTLPTNSEIQQALSAKFELSWSHYLKLMRIDDEHERKFYEIESVKNNEHIFASKYKTVLPSKAELKSLLAERNNRP